MAGLEKKQRVMSPWEQHIIAYHESGHALVAESLTHANRVRRISIIPRGIKETIEGDELKAIMAASRQQAHTQASSPQACPSSPAIPARVAPLNDREGARQVASLAALLPPPPQESEHERQKGLTAAPAGRHADTRQPGLLATLHAPPSC